MADSGIEPEMRISIAGLAGAEGAFRIGMIRFSADGPDVIWHAFLRDGKRIAGETKIDGYPLPDGKGIFDLVKRMDVRLRAYRVAPDEAVLEPEERGS